MVDRRLVVSAARVARLDQLATNRGVAGCKRNAASARGRSKRPVAIDRNPPPSIGVARYLGLHFACGGGRFPIVTGQPKQQYRAERKRDSRTPQRRAIAAVIADEAIQNW